MSANGVRSAPTLTRRPGWLPYGFERSRSPTMALLLLGAITAVGVLLRLPSFEDSLFGDELSTYFIVTDHGLGRVVDLLQGNSVDLNPPLFFVLAWATERLGDAPQLIRLASLLAGIAAIPLTYLLGLWTVGRRAGLVAAALVALSPFLIFYTTEARAYGLVLLLALVSTLALLEALRTGRVAWWVAYAAASCAAIYTHYPPLFLLMAQFAWAFWARPHARRALLAANVAAAIGYLPWLPTLLDNTRSPGVDTIAILNPFGLQTVRTDLGRWSIGHPYLPLASLPGHVAIAMLAAGIAGALVGVAVRVRRAAPARLSPEMVLIAVLALATPVGLALYSAVGDSVWEARNLTASWPALALVVGALVTGARGVLGLAAVALVVGAFAIGGVKMLETASQRPDYDAAASFIAGAGTPRDVVVELPFPAPGPLAPVGDVALRHAGESAPERRRVLRLGAASLRAQLRARPYAPVPVPPGAAVAKRAATLAGGGTLFLVAPGAAPFRELRSSSPTARSAGLEPAFGTGPPATLMTAVLGSLHSFLEALPARARHVETRTYAGFMPVSVYVFRVGR